MGSHGKQPVCGGERDLRGCANPGAGGGPGRSLACSRHLWALRLPRGRAAPEAGAWVRRAGTAVRRRPDRLCDLGAGGRGVTPSRSTRALPGRGGCERHSPLVK